MLKHLFLLVVTFILIVTNESLVGQKKILVVRISAKDVKPSYTEETLSRNVFGSTAFDISYKRQIELCSRKALILEKAVHPTMKNGVYTLHYDGNIIGEDYRDIKRKIVSIFPKPNWTDYVIYCVPPGSVPSWLAFGTTNGWYTMYNDGWCLSLSGKMHEFGHNMGLDHAMTSTHKYGDASGYMGASTISSIIPRMCYNGYHLWKLNWYPNNTIYLDHGTLTSQSYKLKAITEMPTKLPVIIALQSKKNNNSYFISYNKKNSFNNETITGADKITIISSYNNGQGSMYISALSDMQSMTIDLVTNTPKKIILESGRYNHLTGFPVKITTV